MATLVFVAWLAIGMTIPLSGTVEDADGRPVAGATVWLGDTYAIREGSEVLATAETDEKGAFRLEREADLVGRGGSWSPTLWAYKPGKRIAFREFKHELPGADEAVRLVLGPPVSTPCRVLRPDGKPAAGAAVRPAQLTVKAPRPPDTVLDRLVATTDADGRATLDGLAPADVLWVDVTYDGQLVQCLPRDPDDGSATLRPLGGLKVRLVADDPKVLKGWDVEVWSRPVEQNYQGPTTQWRRETTGDDGRIAFGPMAEGVVTWRITPPKGSIYLVTKQPAARIRAGETEEVEISLVKGVRVDGVVLEEPGGAPIPGVKVHVWPLHSSGTLPDVETDAQGRFTAVVTPGAIRFSYHTFLMPKDLFLPPGVQGWVDFEVKPAEERHEFSPPPLRKAAPVRGRVLDEKGEPAAGVAVSGAWSSVEFGPQSKGVQAQTDARGEFVLGGIAPGARLSVTAAAGLVNVSDALIVPKAGEGPPVTIQLRRRPSLSLTGRVLGPDGRPLADAQVRVAIRQPSESHNRGGALVFDGSDEVRTGPDGRYKTPAELPVKHEYRVSAEAPGYEPSTSRWIVDLEGEVPDLTLGKSIGMREAVGWVVDSAGKPVVGAEVFQSGDGPTRTRDLSDAEGRFRVRKIPDVPALLFVAKDGYFFLGRRIESGAQSVRFVLHRLDEPPASRLGSAPAPVSRDEERAIVRDLIAQARKDPRVGEMFMFSNWVAETRALVDPDRTVQMIADQVVAVEPRVLTNVAVGRSDGDPRKVLEILDAIEAPQTTSVTALSLFDRLGASARPSFRRELLDRAEREGRKIEVPGQAASLLARIADRRLDLGDVERGAALVREAMAIAEKPDEPVAVDPRNGVRVAVVARPAQALHGARNDLAPALARVDLPAALKLLDVQADQPHDLDRLRIEVAKRIAATNPAEARRLLGLLQENSRGGARRVVCVRMAEEDLPAARALAAEANDPMLEAVVPAYAARALADSDPATARALLRESVEKLVRLEYSPASPPSPAVLLARLLPLVARLDPDRASSCMWLALSRRSPLPVRERPPVMAYAGRRYLDLAELAALTSRYDRAAAEVVFAPVAARLPGLVDAPWGLGQEGPPTFRAAGTFDARAARVLLDALPEDPTPPKRPPGVMIASDFRHHSKTDARAALAEILAAPPRLRIRELFRPSVGADWLQDLDDRGMDRIEGP